MAGSTARESSNHQLVYLAQVGVAVVLTWLVHELAHWVTGTLLGYEMWMSLNSAGPVRGETVDFPHGMLVAAAGPAVTLLQAGTAFTLLRKTSKRVFYPFLFVPFYMRLLAGGMNVVNLNDEGRISSGLGLGTYTLPFVVSATLLVLVVWASRRAGLGLRLQAATILVTMVVSSALILLDQGLSVRLL